MEKPPIEEIIARLQALHSPDAEADELIAIFLGFKRVEHEILRRGELVKRVLWTPPGANEPGVLPRYTGSMEDAFALACIVAPGQKAGVSWEPGAASARLGLGEYHQAATPQIALCLACADYILRLMAKIRSSRREPVGV